MSHQIRNMIAGHVLLVASALAPTGALAGGGAPHFGGGGFHPPQSPPQLRIVPTPCLKCGLINPPSPPYPSPNGGGSSYGIGLGGDPSNNLRTHKHE